MRQLSILLISILLISLTSYKVNQSHNLVLINKTEESEIKLTAYVYSSTIVPNSKNDTILYQSVKSGHILKKNLPDGRYIIKIEQSSKKSLFFHFYIKDGIRTKFIFDGNIKIKNKKINEYNSLMVNLLKYEKNYFEHQTKNIRNLQPIYDTYLDSIKMLESLVSEEYKDLIIEGKLYLDYALHPIISKRFNNKIGNFFTHKNGTIYQVSGSADSLMQIGFYKSKSYREFLTNICIAVKSLDNKDFFLEGKVFHILKQLDFDLSKAPVISEFIDTSFYSINKFIENHIETTNNEIYAINLLSELAKQYKDDPKLSLKYNKWLIRDFYDCRYVRSGEAQKMVTFHSLSAGSQAPGFIVKNMDGNEIKLSDYNNNYLLIDFWGTWCAPCRNEIPELNELFDASSKLNLKILGIAKDKENVLKKFLDKNEVKYMVAIATDEIIKKYGVYSYPEKFLIDKSGKLIGKIIKVAEVEKLIIENEQ